MKNHLLKYILIGVLCIIGISCHHSPKKEGKLSPLNKEEQPSFNLKQKRDSLYLTLINKIGDKKEYTAAVEYILDHYIIEDLDNPELYETKINQYFLQRPLDYIETYQIGNNTLFFIKLSLIKRVIYLLADSSRRIVDEFSITIYRTGLRERNFSDWDKDGSLDLVETYHYGGQYFSKQTDAVYSLKDNKINLIFCIDNQEVDCRFFDIEGTGIFIVREYIKEDNQNFIITEYTGICPCDRGYTNAELKKMKITNTVTYKMTSQDLLDRYDSFSY